MSAEKKTQKWTAPPVVVKDDQMLVPFNFYLEAVDEIQKLHEKLERAGHRTNIILKHLESITGKSMGLLAAVKANNALNRGRAIPTRGSACQVDECEPGSQAE